MIHSRVLLLQQYLLMREEKFICSFVFELSGFSPKAVVMTRWLPLWIKEDDCSHCQKRRSKVSVSSLQKVQRSLSLVAILYKTEFVDKRLWRNLKLKIIILVLFVHVLVSWNAFSNLFLPHWGRSLCTILFGKLSVFHSLLQRDFYTLNCWVSSLIGKL